MQKCLHGAKFLFHLGSPWLSRCPHCIKSLHILLIRKDTHYYFVRSHVTLLGSLPCESLHLFPTPRQVTVSTQCSQSIWNIPLSKLPCYCIVIVYFLVCLSCQPGSTFRVEGIFCSLIYHGIDPDRE